MVFEDMDTCYGCMYKFGSDPEREKAVSCEWEDISFPEASVEEPPVFSDASANALAWPPPVDEFPDHPFAPSPTVMSGSSQEDASRGESFCLPAIEVSVRSSQPLPAGVSVWIKMEPSCEDGSMGGVYQEEAKSGA